MKNSAAFVNMIQLIHVRVLSNASNLTGNQTVNTKSDCDVTATTTAKLMSTRI